MDHKDALTLSQTKKFRLCQTDSFKNFKFDDSGGKFLKREENTVGKGEIARYAHFFFPLQYFLKDCRNVKIPSVWERS